ncbi:MAG: hypothetical protein CMJ89_03715 [Planctomycetes bacterium]|jgi:hypothetical protein|nr:hypothetical protein [Planctomycetota bacterium]
MSPADLFRGLDQVNHHHQQADAVAQSITPSLVLGLLAIAAAVLVNPLALAPILAADGRIDEPLVRVAFIAFELGLFLFGTRTIWRGEPRHWAPYAAPAAIVLVLFCCVGVGGLTRHLKSQPWEAEGLSMAERLGRLAQRDPQVYFHGRNPELIRKDIEAAASGGRLRGLEQERKLADTYLRRGEFDQAARTLEGVLQRLGDLQSPRRAAFGEDVENLLISTYLRWGELENCVTNHNPDSCLLPLTGGGVHENEQGMRSALQLLRSRLDRNANDLLAKWLLNIAHMALGEYPEGVPEERRLDPSIFASEADLPRFFDIAPALGIAVDDLAGGSVMEDLDGDGDLDLMASGMGRDDPLRFFINTGEGSFEEQTEAAGLTGLTGGLNMCHADYDNDGCIDILVLRGAWKGPTGGLPNSLLRNLGSGEFRDVTEESGLLAMNATSSAVWGDLDGDGWLDLFVGNESRDWHPHPSRLFRNRADGTFEDVITNSGVSEHGFVKGCALGDYDGDGDLDLYVSRRYKANSLYRNDGAMSFEDVTHKAGLGEEFQSFACWFFDYDNDGRLDLFSAGFAGSFLDEEEGGLIDIPAIRLGLETARDGTPRLYHNEGDGTFNEVGEQLGLRRVILVMGANYGDVDNDGWLDMYLGTGKPDFRGLMANRMFRNDAGHGFQDVTTAGGFGHLQKGHAISFGDIDCDGDQDVYAVMGGAFPSDSFPNALFHNPGNENGWINLRLEGTDTNRSAIGARVRVNLETPSGPRAIHRVVGTGGSFGSSSLQVEVGLGDAIALESVEVFWPTSGRSTVFEGLSMNSTYRIREGDPIPGELPLAPIALRTSTRHSNHSH